MNFSNFQGPCLVVFGAICLCLFVSILLSAATIPSGINHKKIFIVCVTAILVAGVIMTYVGINLIALSLLSY